MSSSTAHPDRLDHAAEEDRALKGARTYRNYLAAYRCYCAHAGYAKMTDVRQAHRTLLGTARTHGRTAVTSELKRHLFRGWLTLDAMKRLPLSQQPELASVAALWLPVQGYYACHGLGLAMLTALPYDVPTRLTHAKFLTIISRQVVGPGLLLRPFKILCCGDCTSNTETYENTTLGSVRARRTSNLGEVGTTSEPEGLVLKCLRTTRVHEIEDRLRRERKHLKRKRLTAQQKADVCQRLPPTSCIHFMYRMRINSNYDDADIFLTGRRELQPVEHCGNVLWLTNAICLQLANILRLRVGPQVYSELRREYESLRG